MVYVARWRVILVLFVCLLGAWFSIPNFFNKSDVKAWPSFLYNEQVNLGLDLQGGSSILLEVDLKNVIKDYLASTIDEIRRSLRKEKIGYVNLGNNNKEIYFTLRNIDDQSNVKKLLKKLMGQDVVLDINENGSVKAQISDDTRKERVRMAISQSIEIVRRRIDEMGTKEPSIQQQGEDRILVQLPGVDNPGQVKSLLGKTAKLAFRLVHPDNRNSSVKSRIPLGAELVPSDEKGRGAKGHYLIQKRVDVSGEMLVDAQPTFDQNGQPAVSFSLDAKGARRFADVTRKNIGRPFAIILDNKVISAPVIQSEIPGGNGIITGNFSTAEARDLSILLRAGALPAPLNVLEERTVGPDLGADSIEAGKMATIVAIIAVLVFMILFYGPVFGMAANAALVMNLVLLFACLSLVGATLTLPGIAGIALTLGMAVDANVLIYERIKEEIALGQAPMSAISIGYARAMATIVDSNVTTLIGAALLYQFGTGAVKGFAVTLSIGILISMFTAISLTRVIILWWMKIKGSTSELPLIK
tara:strand:- start:8450 stop:10036 length:1587 start_codon:yes stop_codon:yes gene_type:complete